MYLSKITGCSRNMKLTEVLKVLGCIMYEILQFLGCFDFADNLDVQRWKDSNKVKSMIHFTSKIFFGFAS